MEEIQLKCLTLFLFESMIIQKRTFIDESFAAQFNDFIDHYYEDNKELFSLMFPISLLEEFIKNNYEVLSLKQMMQLMQRYHGLNGYVELVEAVGPNTDEKINKLALLFTEYYIDLLKLKHANPKQYYQKGYPRILQ